MVAATGVQDPGGGGLMRGMTWGLGGLIFAVAWGRPQGCGAPRHDSVHEDNMEMKFYRDQLKFVDSFGEMFCIIR